jgi:hypothetical protein
MGIRPANGRRFLIHVLHHDLPATCVDDECGPVGALVRQRGGQLYGASDLKLADRFGILPPGDPTRGTEQYRPYSVLVVSDPQGKITGIYDRATLATVERFLAQLPR